MYDRSGLRYAADMSIVTLHVLHRENSHDFGELRLAALPENDGERVLVFNGLPPSPIDDHPGLAPTLLQGDLDGKRAYAECIPQGMRLSEVVLPAELGAYVGGQLLKAVEALHDSGAIHGLILPERVLLGRDGEVVLFGRGRRGGSRKLDNSALKEIFRSLNLLPHDTTLSGARDSLLAAAEGGAPEALARFIQRELPPQGTILDQLYLRIGPSMDSLDEVVPDLGTDPGEERGLFDSWGTTTGTGEHTAELTSSERQPHGPPLAMKLWTTLAAPPRHPAPPERFREVDGEPSRGIRALLADEPPDTLPALIGGDVHPFLVAPSGEATDADLEDSAVRTLSPVLDDHDGDTAVYNTRSPDMSRAMREAAVEGQLAAMEARLADAEQRLKHPETSENRILRLDLALAVLLGAALTYLLLRVLG